MDVLSEFRGSIIQCSNGHYYFDNDENTCYMCSVEKKIKKTLFLMESNSNENKMDESENNEEIDPSLYEYAYFHTNNPAPIPKQIKKRKSDMPVGVAVAIAIFLIISVGIYIGDIWSSFFANNEIDYIEELAQGFSDDLQDSESNNNSSDDIENDAEIGQISEDDSMEESNETVDLQELEDEQKVKKQSKSIISYIKKKKYKKAISKIEKVYNITSESESDFLLGSTIYFKDGNLVNSITNGKGLMVAPYDGYAYYGEFKNEKPSGKGIEIGMTDDYEVDKKYWIKGEFKKGKLNGKATIYIYNEKLGDDRYNLKINGTYKNNKENGNISLTYYYKSGEIYHKYYVTSKAGKREIIEHSKSGYVYGETSDGENQIYATEKDWLNKCGHPLLYNY